jgi:small subunit ribosomal protein S6
MPANVYECMFLLDPNKVAGDVPAAAKQLHGLLERHQAEVLASRQWDERRLAYSIGNHKKGLYYLTYFRTEGKNLAPLEGDIHLNEMILRHLVIRVDPKLENIMLQVARDEHALHLQSVTEDASDDGSGKIEEGGEERAPRRGPKREGRDKEGE